jgi:hypothetical protein
MRSLEKIKRNLDLPFTLEFQCCLKANRSSILKLYLPQAERCISHISNLMKKIGTTVERKKSNQRKLLIKEVTKEAITSMDVN